MDLREEEFLLLALSGTLELRGRSGSFAFGICCIAEKGVQGCGYVVSRKVWGK